MLCLLSIVVFWMLSAEQAVSQKEPTASQQPLAKVKVTTLNAEKIERALQLYGRTEPNKVARVRRENQAK